MIRIRFVAPYRALIGQTCNQVNMMSIQVFFAYVTLILMLGHRAYGQKVRSTETRSLSLMSPRHKLRVQHRAKEDPIKIRISLTRMHTRANYRGFPRVETYVSAASAVRAVLRIPLHLSYPDQQYASPRGKRSPGATHTGKAYVHGQPKAEDWEALLLLGMSDEASQSAEHGQDSCGRRAALRKLEDKSTFEHRAEAIARAWIESRLEGTGYAISEKGSLTEALRSGVVLWHLVETIGGKPIALTKSGEEARPSAIDEMALSEESARGTRARMEALHNVRRVFDKMAQMGINVVGCSAQDVVAGARSLHALGVVWAITLRAMQTSHNSKGYSLLRWAALECRADDDAADLEEDPVFLEEVVNGTAQRLPHLDIPSKAKDMPDDAPPSPTIAIRNLDTGVVLKVTPRTLHCSSGIVGDVDTTDRHRRTLNIWNADNEVPTEL